MVRGVALLADYFGWMFRVAFKITFFLMIELPSLVLMHIHVAVLRRRGGEVRLLPTFVYRIAGLLLSTTAFWILAAVMATRSGYQ